MLSASDAAKDRLDTVERHYPGVLDHADYLMRRDVKRAKWHLYYDWANTPSLKALGIRKVIVHGTDAYISMMDNGDFTAVRSPVDSRVAAQLHVTTCRIPKRKHKAEPPKTLHPLQGTW